MAGAYCPPGGKQVGGLKGRGMEMAAKKKLKGKK